MRSRVGTVPSIVLAARSRRAEHLVFGEASSAELFVRTVEKLLRRGMDSGACGFERHGGGEGFDHAAMNGRGSLAVELLVDDGFDESFKR